MVAAPEAVPPEFAPAAVVLAVKPQEAARVLPAYARHAPGAVFLSIMAGRTLGGHAGAAWRGAAVVRAMPNTPAAVRQGVTVACAGPGVDAGQRALCDRLLAAIGAVAWVEDEALLDPVTAVSGSGPAYVFLLAELLERAAIEQGHPGRSRAAAGAADGLGLGRAAGGERGGCGGAAPRRHQPQGHDGAGARRC